ncbi:uncharacterized protein LY89DRAFT_152724 [Mollisia scopiformis]|uniref:Uncharacterized protein n=1 Tax=Mollisia scopiformis TaxID=149040 RepID=A0A194X1L6_MOLSC|nr:uncharacterized protein LY89DRAFT_152724 [Mollisia scopiformis]KUJ14088.1 hypothetical protein LY89DRAFT_152724 [Mollisia scopiformis]
MAATNGVWVLQDSPELELKSESNDQQILWKTDPFPKPSNIVDQVKDESSTNGMDTIPAQMQGQPNMTSAKVEVDSEAREHLEEARTTREGGLGSTNGVKSEYGEQSAADHANSSLVEAVATPVLGLEQTNIADTSLPVEITHTSADEYVVSEPAGVVTSEPTVVAAIEDLFSPDQIK